MKYDISQINHLIKNRRSIFPNMYTGEPVPKYIIEQMLENANWAPTHKFTEPWRFKVFYGEAINKFASLQADLYQQRTTAETFDETKHQKFKEKPLLASCIIAIIMKRDPQGRIPEMEEVAAVSCAVQNMYLTATAHGAGCYWSTGGPTFWEEAKPHFDLGPDDKLMGFLYVGMPADKQYRSMRGDWKEKVEWV